MPKNLNILSDPIADFYLLNRLLRERLFHFPIIKDSIADKARYRRKLEETKENTITARRKYDFQTYDQHSSHYFLTGGRFNRNDTVDSKMLNKYGIFVHRHKPELIYIKSNKKALESFNKDIQEMNSFASKRGPVF
jgi:hypothetical protein